MCITVNLANEVVTLNPISKGSMQEVMDAVKLLYPDWTSITVILVRHKEGTK